MSYISSNPWQDAAAYGGALGDKLSEALIQMPMAKKRLDMQTAQLQQQAKQQQFENSMQQKQLGENARWRGEETTWHNQEAAETERSHKAMEGQRRMGTLTTEAMGRMRLAQQGANAARTYEAKVVAEKGKNNRAANALESHEDIAGAKIEASTSNYYAGLMARTDFMTRPVDERIFIREHSGMPAAPLEAQAPKDAWGNLKNYLGFKPSAGSITPGTNAQPALVAQSASATQPKPEVTEALHAIMVEHRDPAIVAAKFKQLHGYDLPQQ